MRDGFLTNGMDSEMTKDIHEARAKLQIAENVAFVAWEHAADVIRFPNGKTIDRFDRNQFDMWKEAWQAEAAKLIEIVEQ